MTGAAAAMHPNAHRAQAALVAAGSRAQVQVLADSARTAQEAAAALGAEVGQIAKSLVFLADGRPVVVIMSGAHRVEMAALASAVTAREVRKADAGVVREATGYPIGGVSPAGLPSGLPVLIDKSLARYDVVWAAAGTPHAVFPTSYAELLQLTGGIETDVSDGGASDSQY